MGGSQDQCIISTQREGHPGQAVIDLTNVLANTFLEKLDCISDYSFGLQVVCVERLAQRFGAWFLTRVGSGKVAFWLRTNVLTWP
jgi:hypothetical protein